MASTTLYGVIMRYCDNNRLNNLEFLWSGGGEGVGTNYEVLYDYTVNNQGPTDNIIDHADFATSASGTIANSGSPGFGSATNSIVNISQCNGYPSNPNLAGLSWGFPTTTTTVGRLVEFNSVTANYSCQPTSTSTWFAAALTSGTAPVITLPNDGHVYRIEFLVAAITGGIGDAISIGVGTSTTNILAAYSRNTLPSTGQMGVGPVVIPNITASGQTLNVYVLNATGSGAGHAITFQASTSPFSGLAGPSSLSATQVQ